MRLGIWPEFIYKIVHARRARIRSCLLDQIGVVFEVIKDFGCGPIIFRVTQLFFQPFVMPNGDEW